MLFWIGMWHLIGYIIFGIIWIIEEENHWGTRWSYGKLLLVGMILAPIITVLVGVLFLIFQFFSMFVPKLWNKFMEW